VWDEALPGIVFRPFLLPSGARLVHPPAIAMNKEISKGNSVEPAIRVCLVEDDPWFRAKCEEWLNRAGRFPCVGSFADVENALPAIEAATPDSVALDYALPGIRGSAAIRLIKQKVPATRILTVTGIPLTSVVFDALEAGADGFADKDALSCPRFLEIIRATHEGEAPLSIRARKLVLEKLRSERAVSLHWESLTEREKELAHLLRRGLPNKELAREKNISPETDLQQTGGAYCLDCGMDDNSGAVVAQVS
jgi:DNA-binding NarL/FixJ family response regulator